MAHSEKLLQFLWNHKIGLSDPLKTVDGRRLSIIEPGWLNTDAGPDFFNASIKIEDEVWVGNVELHVRASDWFRHFHHNDAAYDSVVLHVVEYDDCPVKRRSGEVIPQFLMRCSESAEARCMGMIEQAPTLLPCREVVRAMPQIYHTDWLTALGMERLYSKSDRITGLVRETGGYWEGALYTVLARALGFGLNGDACEQLARSLPLKFLLRHADNPIAVEAMLFGQGNLIPAVSDDEDEYVGRLREEYDFYAHKFGLKPITAIWRMSRTRPQNFPYRRLALLARYIENGFRLIDTFSEAATAEQLRRSFETELDGYWATHYTFGQEAGRVPVVLSPQMTDILTINVAIPLLHARASERADDAAMERCTDILQSMYPENNSITRLFASAGVVVRDAFTSQALIQLRREYCEKKRCIYCRFGHRLLHRELADAVDLIGY